MRFVPHTVCVELYKGDILEKRIIQAEAASVAKCPDADMVSLKVLTTLIHYLTENTESVNLGEAVTSHKKTFLDVMEGEVTVVKGIKRLNVGSDGDEVEGKEFRNKSKDYKNVEESGIAERMFSKGDVLEALSDCVVVLRRLPVLLAQYKLSNRIILPGYVLCVRVCAYVLVNLHVDEFVYVCKCA